MKLRRHWTSLQTHSSYLSVDVLSSWQYEPKPWIQTITIEWHLDVVPHGREATNCITRVTQCPRKSKGVPYLWLWPADLSGHCTTMESTVEKEKQAQELYAVQSRWSHPSVLNQTDKGAICRAHRLICLYLIDPCLQKPTLRLWEQFRNLALGSQTWPQTGQEGTWMSCLILCALQQPVTQHTFHTVSRDTFSSTAMKSLTSVKTLTKPNAAS